ncbi:hypothetical protein DM793_03355 [Paenarthrobacter nitroguajacolicus]|uniref:hypothetical protein n=1 Tax=Paenarthrobacter nitroguajacolicus TaxID=211146 RepID=UPI0015BE759B|nr:hypothetical protein [Paenarthrobacter nitroguajacolicus]
MRPRPWNFGEIPTLFADYTTGRGVFSNGQFVAPKIGERRKNPNLQDMLDTAASVGAARIMFTGNVPDNDPLAGDREVRHWLLVQTPGWEPGWMGKDGRMEGHWTGKPVTGRFERKATGQRVEVKTAAEWFGNVPLNPEQARQAWDATAYLVGKAFPIRDKHGETKPAKLGKTPASTGTNLWAVSLPPKLDPEQVSDDIAQELHRTSGQHHLEHLVAGPSFSTHEDCIPLVDPAATPKLETFAYVDGRRMYASLCRELGVGPGRRLNRADTADLIAHDRYARARVYVKFTVPHDWRHVGIFGMQQPGSGKDWYYPNRPGAVGEAWADMSEIHVAKRMGWLIEPIEAVEFTKAVPGMGKDGEPAMVAARPLDTFAKRIINIWDTVDEDPEMPLLVKAAVSAAMRAILIQTIGAFASRGRSSTVVAWSPQDVPAQYLQSVQRRGEAYVYEVPAPLSSQLRPYYRPELAVQVWARGRAKVLLGPSALGPETAGALTVPPETLLGINGDAIYTTFVPGWSLPTGHGGGDDGKVGRLRLQGVLNNVKTPLTTDERNKLRIKAVKAGIDAAFFDDEFRTPED